MKLNEDFYVYRMNEANKIYKFGKLDANAAFDYVKEQTGYEITDMTQELLEGARKQAAEKLNKISVLEQMIAFLKDQRGVIAEADKSIQEVKEADTLINSEIKRLEEEVEAIKNGTEKVEESCGKCGTDGCVCETEATTKETETEATTEETEATTEETETEATTEETETKATTEETTNEEAGDEAGVEAEDIKKDTKDITTPDTKEEADDSAPSDEGEEGAKEVVKEDRKSFEELLQIAEDAAADIEANLNDLSEPKKSEEDQEELEASMDEATNEAEIEEELVTRQDGYVPVTLKYKTEEYAEGTEVQIDAEAYTTSGQDESITVFADEKPIKVNKRDVELADGETV